MTNYVALFRGINVGGKNLLPMKALKEALAGLGLEKVQSYIQSGNVVFQSTVENIEQLSTEIGQLIHKQFGFQPKVLILSEADFRKRSATSPFDLNQGKTVHCYYLAETPTAPDVSKLEELKKDCEQWQLEPKIFFLHAPDGVGRSKLAQRAEKCLGVAATARNGKTVLKLLDMLDKCR